MCHFDSASECIGGTMEPARGRAVVDTVPYISLFTPYSICFNTIIILLYLIAA